jgi:hypothetical protein
LDEDYERRELTAAIDRMIVDALPVDLPRLVEIRRAAAAILAGKTLVDEAGASPPGPT